jgi:hypothetical protein
MAPKLKITQGPLYGNLGSVRAFDDSDDGLLYILTMMQTEDPEGGEGLYVAGVNPYVGTVVSAGPLHGDKGISGEVLLQMAILVG